MKTLLLLLSLLLITSACFAQTSAKAPTPVQTTAQLPTPAATPQVIAHHADSLMSEKDYYKKMYEQAAASSSSATNIAWASLGLVATVVALILAYQLWANSRIRESDVQEITSNMQGLIAASETALLGRLSDLGATNIQSLETRAQAIESQLRASINRELDTEKGALKQSISAQLDNLQTDVKRLFEQVRTTPFIIKADEYLAKREYSNALQLFLPFAESRISEREIDLFVAYNGPRYFLSIDELQEPDYIRLTALAALVEKSRPAAYSGFWHEPLTTKPVYRMVSDDSGNFTKKEWIQNPPA